MNIEFPRTWNKMGFTAKAGWLAARMGISYEEACSRLAQRARGRRNKPAAVTVPKQYRLPYADN